MALAPDDVRDTASAMVDYQQRLRDVLEENDWDFAAVSESQAFTTLTEDPQLLTVGNDLSTYLQEQCGIAPD